MTRHSTDVPAIFIASSSEAYEIASAIELQIHEVADIRMWKGAFEPTEYTLETLIKESKECDFGVFVFTPDDLTKSRGAIEWSARDNVILELGMFLGQLDRRRVFIVAHPDVRIPCDLDGVTRLPLKSSAPDEAAVRPATTIIRKQIKKYGQRNSKATKSSARTQLVRFGEGRGQDQRIAHMVDVIQFAAPGTDLIIAGRSLVDWSRLNGQLESAIRDKHIHVKVAVVDPHATFTVAGKKHSWIEVPIDSDWAFADLEGSVDRFREITVEPHTGSLRIYALPFVLSHSFVAYTRSDDSKRYCLEEAGMALREVERPFIELVSDGDSSHPTSHEWMYRSTMTDNRLLLSDDGNRVERDLTQRSKIIARKADVHGLVDLGVGYRDIDWMPSRNERVGEIQDRIRSIPEGGEMFMVGRSLVRWFICYNELAEAIVDRDVRCTLVIANEDANSLVRDFAEADVPGCWARAKDDLLPLLIQKGGPDGKLKRRKCKGYLEVYGIPSYVPLTFASFTGTDDVRYCSIEVGLGYGVERRPVFYFREIPHARDQCIYTNLNNVFRPVTEGRDPKNGPMTPKLSWNSPKAK